MSRFFLFLSAATVISFVCASLEKSDSWNLGHMKSLVTFGDSYTDIERLSYLINHNGSLPPIGWVQPQTSPASDGGRSWPEYVSQYTGCNLYDYAVAGAVCSNNITPKYFDAIHRNMPTVLEYEVPTYLTESKLITNGTEFLDIPASETVYSIWIGTNDLGEYALLTDSQVPGTNMVDFVDCVYNSLDGVYNNGGRYFVIMNIGPLQLSPEFGFPWNGAVGENHYWPDKPSNITQIAFRMWESVVMVNDDFKYRTPFEVLISKRYAGANFAVMDTYGLISDMWHNPSAYLNGTAPLNVTGFETYCPANQTCTIQNADSYLWYDEVHPSEQAFRKVAEEFVRVVQGTSVWATYWG
ncbi:GDSL lipase/acylhydrolase family protein [Rhizodiscina lignyota]|uniref:GDSL lipase/acylhydrolase family protein n=1 Tax=Rhizodiscina lignyota TaxID=1504668 RepID=A0A9P4IM44_9PEZI|nr:GDSL lipase/acylhydrolase family protein [Rhizodiscina lignyota]